MDTLTEEQRKHYTLYNDNVNTDKNNVIEAFFIERAAQLMKSCGVAGIVLPVSVLNRNGMYAHAREIILKCFDIVALAEFGSGTFGQTGTNTVTMFLRRKETNTPDAEHYKNRVNSWFAQRDETNAVYQDEHLLGFYCNHCGYALDDYKAFIGGDIKGSLLNTETVQAYYTSFFGNQRNAMKDVCDIAKNVRNKFLSRAKTRAYKNLSLVEQNQIKEKAFLDFVTDIEKEKVYYFVLAHSVSQPVLLIKAPTSNTDIKKFLGYGWSDSKGNEGIQYLNVGKVKNEDGEDDEDDDDTMSQIRGIARIQTPLFNPANLSAEDKINTLIRKNFMGENVVVPNELEAYVTKGRLVDMLDFSRTAFTKEFKTSISFVEKFSSKYPLHKLGELIKGQPQYGANEKAIEGNPQTDYRYIRITDINDDGSLNDDWKTAERVEKQYILEEGDILFARSGATAGKAFYYKNVCGKALYAGYLIRFKFDDTKAMPLYVYNLLCSNEYKDWVINTKGGTARQNINSQQYCSFEIPLPPMDVQKKIAEECKKIDKEVVEDNEQIRNIEVTISKMMLEVEGNTQKIQKLCSSINPSKSDVNLLDKSMLVSFVEMSSVSNDGYIELMVDKPLAEVRKGSYTYFTEGDIIIAKITPCMENGKCALATGLKNGIGFGSSEFHVFRANAKLINNVYLFAYLNRKEIRSKAAEVMTGSSGHRRVPISFYEDLEIPVPSMDKQMLIAEKYKGLMKDIESLKLQIASASSRKQVILDKYLK